MAYLITRLLTGSNHSFYKPLHNRENSRVIEALDLMGLQWIGTLHCLQCCLYCLPNLSAAPPTRNPKLLQPNIPNSQICTTLICTTLKSVLLGRIIWERSNLAHPNLWNLFIFKINYLRRNLGSLKTAGIQSSLWHSWAIKGGLGFGRGWVGGWVIGAHILYPKVASSSYNTSKSTSTLLAVIDHAKPPVSLSKGERLEICALK